MLRCIKYLAVLHFVNVAFSITIHDITTCASCGVLCWCQECLMFCCYIPHDSSKTCWEVSRIWQVLHFAGDFAFRITIHYHNMCQLWSIIQYAVVKIKRNTCILSCDSLMFSELSSVIYDCFG